MKIYSFFAQIHSSRSDFIIQRTVYSGAPPQNLFNYSLCLALLQVLLRPPRHALRRRRPGMYTGQFIYCSHRATPSIGYVPLLRRILEGAVICNVEHHAADCGALPPGHPGTTPSSSATTRTKAPPPRHPGTTPSSSPATPTTSAKGGPPRTTARPTTLDTFRCPPPSTTATPSWQRRPALSHLRWMTSSSTSRPRVMSGSMSSSLPGITLPHSGTAATHEHIRWKVKRRRGSGSEAG